MESFDATALASLDRRYRANVVNALSGFRTPYLITSGKPGEWNAGTFSNITHVGANPPQLSILFRPDNGKRHTYENYKELGSVTLCMMPFNAHERVHNSSVNAPQDVFEWEHLGGESIHPTGWPHPIPKEALWAMEVQFLEQFELNNGCIYTVGSIDQIALLNGSTLTEDGHITINESVIAASGLQSYHEIDPKPARLSYPKASSFDL